MRPMREHYFRYAITVRSDGNVAWKIEYAGLSATGGANDEDHALRLVRRYERHCLYGEGLGCRCQLTDERGNTVACDQVANSQTTKDML